jgi:hypothetical protein
VNNEFQNLNKKTRHGGMHLLSQLPTGINRRFVVQATSVEIHHPSQNISKTKRADGVAQVVECLPTKHELKKNPSSAKKKKIPGM